METNRTAAERELAKLNEVSALDARRTHHRLVELLTDSDRRGHQDAARQVERASGGGSTCARTSARRSGLTLGCGWARRLFQSAERLQGVVPAPHRDRSPKP